MVGRLKAKEGKVVDASCKITHESMTAGQLRQKVNSLQGERRVLKRRSVFLEEKVAH